MRVVFNRPLRILLTTDGLVLMGTAMLGPIYAIFVEGIGGSLLDASITGGVFALAAGVFTLLVGRITDHVREKENILVIGYVVVGLGFLLYLTVHSIAALLVVQVVIGLGRAMTLPVFDVLYSSHVPRRARGVAWGAWEAMNYFVAALGATIGGIIVSVYSFSVLFVVMASLCFLSACYIFVLPRSVL